jgi:CubicO group peptidase (beta-lactamase class C family)
MKPSARLLFVFCAILLAPSVFAQSLSVAPPEELGFSTTRLERLTHAMQSYVEDGLMAGAVVLVARHGQIAYVKAFGKQDLASGTPMTEDTIFRIASQTKAIVSAGILILQEEGRLLISDPVGKYIPEFEKTTVAAPKEGGGYDVVPAKRPITIRDLLTHTAGIGYGNGPAADQWKAAGIQGWYFADRDEPVGATIARMGALPMDAQPGEKYVYGYNTDILGVVIEKASGQTLDTFLQDRIFGPLGMNDTHFYLPMEKKNRLATVYSSKEDGSGIERAPEPGHMVGQGMYVTGPRKSFSGGAGLLSTARDYARFLQMTLNGGVLDGQRVLSEKSIDLMTANHLREITFNPGEGFGLGFSVLEDLGDRGEMGSVGEYGWGGAYHSTYWVDPAEDLVVVYFTQLIPARNIDDHDRMRVAIYQALIE